MYIYPEGKKSSRVLFPTIKWWGVFYVVGELHKNMEKNENSLEL